MQGCTGKEDVLTHSTFSVISSKHTGHSLRVPSWSAAGPRTGSSRMGRLACSRCPARSRLCEVLIWARALQATARCLLPLRVYDIQGAAHEQS